MGGGQSRDGRGQCQVAGARPALPARAPLGHEPRPGRVPVDPLLLETARARRVAGQDQRPDHTGALHHPGVKMRGARRQKRLGGHRIRRVHGDVVPRGEHHQGVPGDVLGQGRAGRVARRALRRAPAYDTAGRLLPALADRLGRKPARRHVPRLHPADVPHLDRADPCPRQQRRHHRAHPARTSDLHPHAPPRRQHPQRVARTDGGQAERGPVRAEPVQHLGSAAQGVGGRPAAPGVVQQPRPRQPPHQPVDVTVGQLHAPALLTQQLQSPRAVEQLQQAARGRVHRAQGQRLGRCHPELHGIAVPPASPEGGLEHRMHD